MAKSIEFGTKIILQVSPINVYGRSCMRMLVLTLLTFKKVKLIFGHPVPLILHSILQYKMALYTLYKRN